MIDSRNDIHAKQVDAWALKNTAGLPPEKLVRLFEIAIQAIEQRSLTTLSSVTVMVVLDRALHQSKEIFPLLAAVTLDPKGVRLDGIIANSGHHKPEELQAALRHLLVEILSVFGNITAEVLTVPLQKELSKITCESVLKTPEAQGLRVIKSPKTNQEDR